MTSKKTKPIWAEEISGNDFHVGNLVINNLSKNRRAMWDWKKDIINHATTRKTFLSWTDKKTWQQYSIMRLSGQFQVCFFFYKKISCAKKHKQTTNKTTQRQQVFAYTKTSKWVKVVCFAFWCFLCVQNIFLKKTGLKLS